jgi:hypothetical protein
MADGRTVLTLTQSARAFSGCLLSSVLLDPTRTQAVP